MGTTKGERRRQELVAAAAELLRSGGFDAVRHRAVAERAGLPLASTTYYFASLDDLVTAAVELTSREELDEGRAQLAGLTAAASTAAASTAAARTADAARTTDAAGPEQRAADGTARPATGGGAARADTPEPTTGPELVELVLDQLLGPESRDGGLDAVLLRYERLVGAGRRPYLAPLMRELRGELDALLDKILCLSGHPMDPVSLRDLVSLVDGAVISALIEADPDPRAAAREVLLRTL